MRAMAGRHFALVKTMDDAFGDPQRGLDDKEKVMHLDKYRLGKVFGYPVAG